MKISEMLAREDFYEINRKTLNAYFGVSDQRKTSLYVYPKLNAIITNSPGKTVREYLLTEFSVRSPWKRIAAAVYVMLCLCSKGALSDRKITVCSEVGNDVLIYPCNKKIRIFDFRDESSSVIIKYGFDDTDLQHEMEFRKRKDNPSFVPRMIECTEYGYKEQIIKGKPLARITCKKAFDTLRNRAYQMFRDFYQKDDEDIDLQEYLQFLRANIVSLSERSAIIKEQVQSISNKLITMSRGNKTVTVGFSHGDLQPGNIWIGSDNNIYIIDWESWGKRSIWYDYTTLFEKLRPGKIEQFLFSSRNETEKALVLLEDIVFQLHELNSLPEGFGVSGIRQYLNSISDWLGKLQDDATQTV